MHDTLDEFVKELNQHKLRISKFTVCDVAPEGKKTPMQQGADIRLQINGVLKRSASCSAIVNNSLGTCANNADKSGKRKKAKPLRTFNEKIFTNRQSYLTTFLEINHMLAVYHICCIIFILFCVNNILFDYFSEGTVYFGLGTFKIGFYNIHYVLGTWVVQHIFMFITFYALKGWSLVRALLARQRTLQITWSFACLMIYIGSQVVFACVPAKLCLMLDLPFVSAFVLLIETIRMLMKMHSFVRTMSARISQGKETLLFRKYLYFLFAPTLLYRDNYPRTRCIRWKFAASRLMEVVVVAFLHSYIFENNIHPTFKNFGIEKLNSVLIANKFFTMILPSAMILLSIFYLILHSWLNFTSEILRFGDRMFYRDWWTAKNFDDYYRTWNIVVHDFLFEFVYKDFYIYIFKGSKLGPLLAVYLISAVFHEYLLGFALQCFFPAIFVFFAVTGIPMIFVTRHVSKTIGNIIIWFSMICGPTCLTFLYTMEYFASKNCPKDMSETWRDRLIPYIWYCYK